MAFDYIPKVSPWSKIVPVLCALSPIQYYWVIEQFVADQDIWVTLAAFKDHIEMGNGPLVYAEDLE